MCMLIRRCCGLTSIWLRTQANARLAELDGNKGRSLDAAGVEQVKGWLADMERHVRDTREELA